MQKTLDQNRAYVTTSQAAKRSGLSSQHLARLLRAGKLEGFQLSRTSDWIIYTDSLEKFLASPRKPGPRGPRKKQLEKDNQSRKIKEE